MGDQGRAPWEAPSSGFRATLAVIDGEKASPVLQEALAEHSRWTIGKLLAAHAGPITLELATEFTSPRTAEDARLVATVQAKPRLPATPSRRVV